MAAVSRHESRPRVFPRSLHHRQRFLGCLVCGAPDLCSAGLCRTCYDAAYRSETYFGGHKEAVLERDGRCCRTCGARTDIVHHRRPGCNDPAGLIALCLRCHATVHRLRRVDRYLPPLLLALWREQHPDIRGEQLPLLSPKEVS